MEGDLDLWSGKQRRTISDLCRPVCRHNSPSSVWFIKTPNWPDPENTSLLLLNIHIKPEFQASTLISHLFSPHLPSYLILNIVSVWTAQSTHHQKHAFWHNFKIELFSHFSSRDTWQGAAWRVTGADHWVMVTCTHDGRQGQPWPPHQRHGDGVLEGGIRPLRPGQGWGDQHGGARKGQFKYWNVNKKNYILSVERKLIEDGVSQKSGQMDMDRHCDSLSDGRKKVFLSVIAEWILLSRSGTKPESSLGRVHCPALPRT